MQEQKLKELSSHAATARAIRQELKQAYPHIKFRVVSDSFANGDSVDIRYIDGIPEEKIEILVKKYQKGYFDGMTDLYEYSNEREDIPQVKYVCVQRSMSDETKKRIMSYIIDYYGLVNFLDSEVYEKFGCWTDQLIYRKFREATIIGGKLSFDTEK